MADIIKVLKTEIRKYTRSRVSVVLLSVVALLILLFVTVLPNTVAGLSSSAPMTEEKRRAVLALNAESLADLQLRYDYFRGKPVEIPPGVILNKYSENDEMNRQRLLFLASTATIDADYYAESGNQSGWPGTAKMFFIGKISPYILMLLAFVIAAAIVVPDYRRKLKNYYAAGVSRKSVFLGKIVFAEILLCAAFVLTLLIGLCFGLTSFGATMLYYSGGVYSAVNCLDIWLCHMLGTFVLMQLAFALPAALGALLRNAPLGAVIPLLLVLIMYFVVGATLGIPTPQSAFTPFLPVLGLLLPMVPLGTAAFFVSAILHLLVAAAAIVLFALFGVKRNA